MNWKWKTIMVWCQYGQHTCICNLILSYALVLRNNYLMLILPLVFIYLLYIFVPLALTLFVETEKKIIEFIEYSMQFSAGDFNYH